MNTKKIIALSFFVGCLSFCYINAKDFSIRDFYNNTNSAHSSEPGDFQTQEMLGDTFSGREMEVSESTNPETLKDSNLAKNIKENDRKVSKEYIKIQDLESKSPDSLTDRLKRMTLGRISGLIQSSLRINCYLARGQSFYTYKCDKTGEIFGGAGGGKVDANSISPDAIKENCQNNCYTASSCVRVTPIVARKPSILYSAINFSKDNTSRIENSTDVDRKIAYFTFEYESEQDLILYFTYTDADGKDRNLAKAMHLQKTGKGKSVSKKYRINRYIKRVSFSFELADPKVKQDAVVKKIALDVGEGESWVCRGKDISNKSDKNKLCNPEDRVQFRADNGDIIEICKSQVFGDNEDGSFSTEGSCMSSCRVDGTCTLVAPALNVNSFFSFDEGCMNDEESCSKQKCTEARENLAPILNEWVYDGLGNRIQTIQNGVPVRNTVRPRILATQDTDYQQRIQEETKELARVKMVDGGTYVMGKKIGEDRETSYAHSVDKNNLVNLKIKPSNTLYNQPMYVYVIADVTTSTPDWKISVTREKSQPSTGGTVKSEYTDFRTKKEMVVEEKSYTSRFFYVVNGNGDYEAFYRLNNEGSTTPKGGYMTFSSNSWGTLERKERANYFTVYTDVLDEVKKNKYFINIPFFTKNEILSKVVGVPYKRYFDKDTGYNDDYVADDTHIVGTENGGNGVSNTIVSSKYNWDSKFFRGELYSAKEYKAFREQEKIRYPGIVDPQEKYVYSAGDVNFVTQIHVIASDKELTYEEIFDKLNSEDEKGYLPYSVWNDVGFRKGTKTILKSDNALTNESFNLYYVGRPDNMSAYVTFVTDEEKRGENAYFFLWKDEVTKGDSQSGSIKHLEPSSLKIHDFKKRLLPSYQDYVIFENQNMQDDAKSALYFGYGTGEFDTNKDCKSFTDPTTGKTEQICLSWWKIEREYDSIEAQTISDSEIKNMFNSVQVPLEGRKVKVCSEVDPFANEIFNQGSKLVSCVGYYSRTASPQCADNPIQKDCYVTTCSDRLKKHCKKKHTFEFGNGIRGVSKILDSNGDASYNESDIRVNVKGYVYECPETSGFSSNHVCLKTEEVVMNPANCGDSDVITDEQKQNLKSNWIYCSTNKPIYEIGPDGKAKVTGFQGTCPSGKVVTCGIEQLTTTTRTCELPVYEVKTVKDVSTKSISRSCQEVYVDISKGEVDKYKDLPNCYRINTADDSRGGIHDITFSADGKTPTLKISAVSENGANDDIFCVKTGNNSKLAGCKDNSASGAFYLDAHYKMSGASQIIFVEQAGKVVDSDDVILGIDRGDFFSSLHTFNWETEDRHHNRGWKLGGGWSNQPFNNITTRNNGGGITLPNQKHRSSDFDFFSNEILITTKGNKIAITPEVNRYNFQFLTEKCTQGRDWHGHHYDWDVMYHYACEKGDRGLPDKKDHWESGESRHIVYGNERALKIYQNALAGVTILFPSASSYQVKFKTKSGAVLRKYDITYQMFKSVPVGTIQNIRLGNEVITQKGIDIKNRLIPQKEEEIRVEEEKLSAYHEIKKDIVTYHFKTSKVSAYKWDCTDSRAKHGPVNDGCNTGKINHWFHVNHDRDCYGVNIFNGQDPVGWAQRLGNRTFCVANYHPSYGINDRGKNRIIDCNIDAKLQQLKKELQVLKDELTVETPRTGAYDDFSPVGGGTHFGIDSTDKHSATQDTQSLDRIKANSIYEIEIIDNESGARFVKKLLFPLPYINRIFYTYLKDVDRRAYKCCQDF